jgi:hypothetical protein
MSRALNGQFLPGTGGRKAGTRNKLQAKFIEKLAEDFGEHGEGVIRIVRLEKPNEYLKIVASILPKEFLVSDNAIDEIGEDELLQMLEEIRKAKALVAG